MSPLKAVVNGVTDEGVGTRIGWMALTFFAIYVPVTIVSFYLLPEGVLRGKHPIISRLHFSPTVWVCALQIFAYNLVPTGLIVTGNLLAQQSRLVKHRYVPIGYTAFWGLTALFAVITGSWSFDVVATAPPLLERFTRLLDISRRAGLLEFSAYLLAATASFGLTLWYSDGKTIVATRGWRDVSLTRTEAGLLMLALILLLCAACVESHAIAELGR